MKVLLTGASGLVGTALQSALRAAGHEPVALVRPPRAPQAGEIRWDPQTGELDAGGAAGASAVVNLAGASIAAGRWTAARKQLLYDSRVQTTRALVAALAQLTPPPAVLVSASAIGYYGDRGEEILTESSSPGRDFLAQLACDWEAAALAAERYRIRVVICRFGMILSASGGALARMLPAFRLGLGGPLGNGHQWMSWISLDDVVQVIRRALENPSWQGVYNVVAPEPVRNRDFARTLGNVLHRPAILPVPAIALRLLFGEMAESVLLASQRVLAERLRQAGYQYSQNELAAALHSLLNR